MYDELFLFCINNSGQLELQIFEEKNDRPTAFVIRQDSRLYKHIIDGNARHGTNSFMNPVPTLLKDGEGKRICVFTHFTWGDSGPAVYFYDLTVGREVAKASGAQIFLALIQIYAHEFQVYLHLDYKLGREVVGKNCPIISE